MSNKHFIALADVLKTTKPIQGVGMSGSKVWERELASLAQWEFDRDKIGDFCAKQGPGFDRTRWLMYIAGTNEPSGGEKP